MLNPFDQEEPYFLINNSISSTKIFKPDLFKNCRILYEVIRVIDKKPLFINEHLERMQRSCLLSDIKHVDFNKVKSSILSLLEKNPVKEKNLKISLCIYPNDKLKPQLIAYFIESHYPPESDYLNGVNTELLSISRSNPNVKLENPALRGKAEKMICISQTTEVLLVDENGCITEGSRSNFFAVRDGALYTAPSNVVLEGITRAKVIDLSQSNGIPVHSSLIHSTELNQFEGAFITGTSSKVLPIKRIGDQQLNPQEPTIKRIMMLYDELVNRQLVN